MTAIDAAAAEEIIRRLRCAAGQLAGVIRMLEQRRDYTDTLTQLAAVRHALRRAGIKLVSTGLQHQADVKRAEELFVSIA